MAIDVSLAGIGINTSSGIGSHVGGRMTLHPFGDEGVALANTDCGIFAFSFQRLVVYTRLVFAFPILCISICRLKHVSLFANSLLQMLHLNGPLLCVLKCFVKVYLRKNRVLHCGHEKGSSLLWVIM